MTLLSLLKELARGSGELEPIVLTDVGVAARMIVTDPAGSSTWNVGESRATEVEGAPRASELGLNDDCGHYMIPHYVL